jgi:nicotinamidase/pyrazinamidase
VQRIFFMDVDTQRDFIFPSGALYVPGAERLLPKLRRLFDCARRNGIFVLSTADAHGPGDPELADFPPHCMKGTPGQRKLDETLLPRPLVIENRPLDRNLLEAVRRHPQIVCEKQAIDPFSNPVLERLTRALPPHAFVFGVATDHCVRAAVLGLRRLGVKAALVTDASRGLTPESETRTLAEMRAAGADFTTTDDLLAAYAG